MYDVFVIHDSLFRYDKNMNGLVDRGEFAVFAYHANISVDHLTPEGLEALYLAMDPKNPQG